MAAVAGTGSEIDLGSAKRNVALLTTAQAILGSAPPIAFAAGGLAAYQMLGDDKGLATAPLTGFNVGTALGAIGVALAARYLGRKLGFIAGACIMAMSGLIATIAVFQQNFWLMIAGFIVCGFSAGFTQKIRFAAADASPTAYKATAISWILAGGIISGLLGPQLAIYTEGLFETVPYAGAFMMFVPLGLIAAAVMLFLRLPALTDHTTVSAEPARPLSEIVMTQRFMTGMFCGISSYCLMTFMMTGAPLAMVYECGFSNVESFYGIQYHVLGMFGPSFFTGKLINRFGAERVVAAGLGILMVCAVVAHAGVELWNFWGALILLGIGWNFGFIGSTAIVASSYRPSEADKVQGFNDIILFSSVALASFASGLVFNAFGWAGMILPVWPLAITGLVLLFLLSRRKVAVGDPA
ncbi:MFS transporter [Rhizobium sp. LjRoot254]|uniref:MFS transporter n=1 Tax=Rhizobium sp. LjRoot254 TaxID=3342297 RepID=UPI003ECE08CB